MLRDPEVLRWLQRISAMVIYAFCAGYLKLSAEQLSVIAGMCGAMVGQTIAGYGHVDARALEKLGRLLASKPPSNPPPPMPPE